MTFPAISITTSTPFVFRWSVLGLKENFTELLQVYVNPSSADVYYGDEPGAASTLTGAQLNTGSDILTVRELQGGDIVPGMVLSDVGDPADDGKYVVAVDKERQTIQLNAVAAATHSDAVLVFTPPAITSANGQPILQGTQQSFVADHKSQILQGAIRFVVASGTAVIRVRYKIR